MNNIIKTDCPLEYASFIIGGKWKLRILWILSQADYVRSYDEIPPRVEYTLTENGLKLIEALVPINKWSEETLKKI